MGAGLVDGGVQVGFVDGDDVDDRPGGVAVQYVLVGRSVVIGEDGAQGFVPVGEVMDRLTQGLDVQLAGQP